MSVLGINDRRYLEDFLGMSSGYVLNFSDRTFGEFVFEKSGLDIHSARYTVEGTSKAKKLRLLFKLESDFTVGTVILALIEHRLSYAESESGDTITLAEKCRQIATRLLAGGPNLTGLKEEAKVLDAGHLADQIRRLEASIATDPGLAIGTAKELVETCCKTILAERGKPVAGNPDISTLTKETLKELKLVPEGVSEATRGADVIKRLLRSIGSIGNDLAELRGLYGTGHGKHGSATGLSSRHAKLAVGAASALTIFLFETHKENR